MAEINKQVLGQEDGSEKFGNEELLQMISSLLFIALIALKKKSVPSRVATGYHALHWVYLEIVIGRGVPV